MSIVFGDFVVKLFSKFADSMKPCCSPTPDTIEHLDRLHRKDSRSRRRTISQLCDATASTAELGESEEDDLSSPCPYDSVYEYFETKYDREALLFWGYVRRIDAIALRQYDQSPILNLCLSFYCIPSRTVQRLYLVAEQCDSPTYPSLDDSADEIDEDDPIYSVSNGPHSNPRSLPFLRPSPSNGYFGGVYVADMSSTNSSCARAGAVAGDRDRGRYVNVYQLDDPQSLSVFGDEWILKFSGMTTAKDILLPPSVHRTLWEEYSAKKSLFGVHGLSSSPSSRSTEHIQSEGILKEYTVLFKLCGSGKMGWTNSCSAVIVDETALRRDSKGLFAFNWDLPHLPIKTGGNGVAFSTKHGLLSVGGYRSNQCYSLSFSSPSYFDQDYDWNWTLLPEMSESRWFPSCTMLGDDCLIAMAGSSNDHEPLSSVEMLHFGETEPNWSLLAPCHNARKYGGLSALSSCTTSNDVQLYLGGGDHATHSVECYDPNKNIWRELPDTGLPHRYYPNLWRDASNEHLIYISCSYSNSIECLDLRSRETTWRTVGPTLFDTDSLDLDYNQFRCVM